MAIVESAPSIERPPWTGVLHEWVTTVDHKKLGIMYFLMALSFLVVGGVEALVMRFQLLSAESKAVPPGAVTTPYRYSVLRGEHRQCIDWLCARRAGREVESQIVRLRP